MDGLHFLMEKDCCTHFFTLCNKDCDVNVDNGADRWLLFQCQWLLLEQRLLKEMTRYYRLSHGSAQLSPKCHCIMTLILQNINLTLFKSLFLGEAVTLSKMTVPLFPLI